MVSGSRQRDNKQILKPDRFSCGGRLDLEQVINQVVVPSGRVEREVSLRDFSVCEEEKDHKIFGTWWFWITHIAPRYLLLH
jgi:hypothetical protein